MATVTNRRMPLSCEPCRERKIRCPRNTNRGRGPCETCVRRGIPPPKCVYLRDLHLSREYANVPQVENSALISRINKLEELLHHHVGTQSQTTNESDPRSHLPSPESSLQLDSQAARHDSFTIEGPSPTPAILTLGTLVQSDTGHEHYEPSSSRWSSILRVNPATSGLKGDLDVRDAGNSFPFVMQSVGMHELLSMLPPLSPCDELKNIFFGVYAPLFHVLHDPTFEAAYSQFRQEPDQVSLSWLALLFAILSVAITAVPEENTLLHELGRCKTTLENMSLLCARYRAAAMKCLEADHYLWRHNLQTLQTLVLLIYGINHTHGQSWALLGTARNIALSLGCHVDPDAFNLDIVAAEERRRCWAGLNMLYTIQNTTLGNLESVHTHSNVKPPLDVNDDQLVSGSPVPHSPQVGPSQMSYLLLKFDLYDICSRICNTIFGTSKTPTFGAISLLDAEIAAQQDNLNYKYLLGTTTLSLADSHAVHLNILFGYSHQLVLLLHRPVLMHQFIGEAGIRYTVENFTTSRSKCVESSRALLGIHRMLHEDEAYRPYRWYNRGLGSFHAFHAIVLLAYIHGTSTDLDSTTLELLRRDILDGLAVFEQIEQSGLSKICERATPILKSLLYVTTQEVRHASTQPCAKEFQQSYEGLDMFLGSLEPHQWLSPSTMDWGEWDATMLNVL
ncbi:hypothetical protein B0J13DRAFT_460615 [Dactylonectria estremocensis]|uniref:Zn(2)-C6 fungal-type domain-containing protein n=1 Tax=Dactylonectria estremocensis TaxID=1079267 RepID=A0A9P9D5J1_9HYPO|nr:hypothetical protein B0J13DRAFT_460615 [Dactylonectria estremocensis]